MLEHVHEMLWMTKNSNMFTIRMGSNISRYFELIEVEFSSFIYLLLFLSGSME